MAYRPDFRSSPCLFKSFLAGQTTAHRSRAPVPSREITKAPACTRGQSAGREWRTGQETTGGERDSHVGLEYDTNSQASPGRARSLHCRQRDRQTARLGQAACTPAAEEPQHAVCGQPTGCLYTTSKTGRRWKWPQGGEKVCLTRTFPRQPWHDWHSGQQPHWCQGGRDKSLLEAGLELLVAGGSPHAAHGMDIRDRREAKCKAAASALGLRPSGRPKSGAHRGPD